MDSDEESIARARVHISKGEIIEASVLAKGVLSSDPRNPDAKFLMAQIARMAGQLELALDFIESLDAIKSEKIEFVSEHAEILQALGRFEKASKVYERLLRLDPNHFGAHEFLGRQHASNLRLKEACHHLSVAVSLRPDPDLFNLLGHSHLEQKRGKEAEAALRKCLEIVPGHVEALLCLANIFRDRGNLNEALDFYQKALAAEPNHPDALHNLANTCLNACIPISRCAGFPQLDAEALSHMVFALNYQSEIDRDRISKAHRIWGDRQLHQFPLSARRSKITPQPGQPIRIGLISSDFYQHPVGRYAVLLCSHLNRVEFSPIVYNSGRRNDTLTSHLQSIVSDWRDISNQTDEEVLDQIKSDRIDILLDLSGHTANNRLAVFARRAAPVQIIVFAYPNTSGLTTMDFRISDSYADPPGETEHLGTEKLIRLSNTAWTYLSLATAPEIQPPPNCSGKPFTFGCLNNPLKFSTAAIQLWSEILKHSPQSRLMLLSNHEAHDSRLMQRFKEHNVSESQITFARAGFLTDYFDYYQSVDLILDSFPYNGAITTCDALWMGVPVLALEGDTYVSRQGVSILSNLGLKDYIARTPNDYVNYAIERAVNPGPLRELRETLRSRLQHSPLMDYEGYGNDISNKLKEIWDSQVN